MIPVRLMFLALVLGTAAGGVIAGGAVASAAPKAAPTATPAASPAASPSATPEPLTVAIPRLEAALKANPNDRDTMGTLASVYVQAGRPLDALTLTQKLLSTGAKQAQTYYTEGFANQALGRDAAATNDFEQAANLEPTNVGVLTTLVQTYLRQNRGADAERVAKRAITFNKDNKEATVTYGLVYAAERKFAQAREQFEAAAKLDPKDAHPLALEAQTYVDENAVALAQSVYDRALAADPNSQEALLGKARISAAAHDVKGAIALFDRVNAQQQDPADKVALQVEEAKLYATEKMTTEAEALLKSTIAAYPSVPAAHVAYGDYLAQYNPDKSQAEKEWIAAGGANRDNPDALLRLGAYYNDIKQPARALDQYKRLAEIDRGDPRVWLALAQSYVINNQPEKAREAYKNSYGLQHTPDALLGLAAVDFKSRNYGECAQVLEGLDRAVPQLAKQNPNVLYTLGKCFQGTNQSAKARATYVKLLGFVPEGNNKREVQGLIDQIDRSAKSPAPKPKATASPSGSAKK